MQSFYVLAPGTNPSAYVARSQALGCPLSVGDPTGLVTIFPSVAITSWATAASIFPDNELQVTVLEVQSAEAAVSVAESVATANQAALKAIGATLVTQNQSFLATAIPSTAQIDAQITLLTKAVNALIHLVTGDNSVAGTPVSTPLTITPQIAPATGAAVEPSTPETITPEQASTTGTASMPFGHSNVGPVV